MKTKILFTILLSTTLIACDKENVDTTKPVITLNAPSDGDVLAPGEVHFDMELSDDTALGSYKVDIHNADDGHAHASLSRSGDGHDEGTPFSFQKSWNDIAGKRNAHIHHHEIVIPADAKHGKYHLIVYCSDEAGNEERVVRSITIGDEASSHDEH